MNWQSVTYWLMWPGWAGGKKEIRRRYGHKRVDHSFVVFIVHLYCMFNNYAFNFKLFLSVVVTWLSQTKSVEGQHLNISFFYCYASFHSFISCLCYSWMVEATDRVAASHCCSYKYYVSKYTLIIIFFY
jgi:hypothetical protein